MGQVEQLYKIQEIDTEIQEKKRRLRVVLKAQKGDPTVTAARQRAETAAADLQRLQTKRTDLTLELEGLNQKAKKSEQRLYSGKVTNPKELSDLQREIESLGRRREMLEEEILETMIEIEDAQAVKQEVDEALAEVEKEWEKKVARLKEEQNELALRLHHLMESRKPLVKTVSEELMADYETLIKQKDGVAVARLRVNQCMSCQLAVSMHKAKEVREGKILHCGGCGRILYPVGV